MTAIVETDEKNLCRMGPPLVQSTAAASDRSTSHPSADPNSVAFRGQLGPHGSIHRLERPRLGWPAGCSAVGDGGRRRWTNSIDGGRTDGPLVEMTVISDHVQRATVGACREAKFLNIDLGQALREWLPC